MNSEADVVITGFDARLSGLLAERNTDHGQPGLLFVRADDHYRLTIKTDRRWLDAITDGNHRQTAGNTLL